MARKGIIGDTQFPAVHPGYLTFCQDMHYAWDCTTFMHMGDVNDLHYPSFHDNHPDMPGAKGEYLEALACVQLWQNAYPIMDVCIGNHDERSLRVGAKYGVTEEFYQPYDKIWQTPQWTWGEEFIEDEILYTHGTGKGSAEHPAYNFLKKGVGMSVVIGHYHTRCGIKWLCGPRTRWFAMDVGCGIDRKHPAMAYDRHNPVRQVLACAAVIDGHPYQEVMPMGRGEKYHRSKFTKRSRK